MTSGPLSAVRVLEFAGKGPVPFAAMVLAGLGADVLRIDRLPRPRRHADYRPETDLLQLGRPSVALDLRSADGLALAKDLLRRADVLVEGYRPGVMERLGLGPAEVAGLNPGLVYGRATGWGQSGPLAAAAGHDINYLALSGVLHLLGRAGEPPTPPANLLADFGGGGMLLAMGVLAGLAGRSASGRGTVVDAAMLDGATQLATLLFGLRAGGMWSDERGTNLLDTGAPYYDVYRTADDGWIAVGAVEPVFFERLVTTLGLRDDPACASPADRATWPAMRARFTEVFGMRTRDEWVKVFAGVDACVTPVLTPEEAAAHPHNQARGLYRENAGVLHPAVAPRFAHLGEDTAEAEVSAVSAVDILAALRAWGVPDSRLDELQASGSVEPGA